MLKSFYMRGPETFKPKSETELRQQVRRASEELGEELLPEGEDVFELTEEELKKRYPDRYEKYVQALRKTGRKEHERKALERSIDAGLQELFTRHMVKINEGNSGFILRLNFEDIQPELIGDLKKHGIEIRDNQAAKILKVYNIAAAEREFDLQERAYESVAGHTDDPAYAGVPRPYFARNVEVTSVTRELLKAKGVKVGDHVGVIMMDFVPGEDLAAKLLKEVMRRSPELRHYTADEGRLLSEYEKANFHELPLDEIAAAAGFSLPGGKAKSREEREWERQRVFDENEERLIAFLEERGFQIHPAILEQMRNTLDAFHRNGLVFRDGHHRNFMIDGDIALPPDGKTAEVPRTTIIDFGGSAAFTGDYAAQESDLYADPLTGKRYKNDYAVIRELEHLAVPPAERRAKKESAFMDKLRASGAVVLKREQWKKFQEDLAGVHDPEALARFIDVNGYRKLPTGDERVNYLLGLLLEAGRSGRERLQQVGDALMKLRKTVNQREAGIIQQFLSELGYRSPEAAPEKTVKKNAPAVGRGVSRRSR